MVTVKFTNDYEWIDGGYFMDAEWRQVERVHITCETCGYGLDGYLTLGIDYLRNMRDHRCQPS